MLNISSVFLVVLALIYLVIASLSDLKKREVANWLCFSLLAFGLAYRGFFALLNKDLSFFLFGLEGLAFCFVLAFGFYYGRVFAGGDTKLLIALGPFITIAGSYMQNLYLLIAFVFLLMVGGSVYGIFYSLIISFTCRNFWSKFIKRWKKSSKLFYTYLAASLFFLVLSIIVYFYLDSSVFFLFPVLFFLFPLLYVYAKTIEEECFTRNVSWKDVTIGDWLVEKVRIGRKMIYPYWEGLSEEEVKLIRKGKKNVRIKYGIPFIPSFLIGFILLVVLKEKILDYVSFLF